MSRDYNPNRYRTRSSIERDERTRTERELDKALAERDKARAELDVLRDEMEVLDRAVRNLTRQVDIGLDQQHRYRIAFMLFAQNMRPNFSWAELWAYWLMKASQHIGGKP